MGVYVFYGEEDFLREYKTEKIIADCKISNLDMNFIKLNDDNIGKFIQNCEQVPFFDEKKVILIKNSGFFTSSKKISSSVISEITEYMEKLPDYVVVIFDEDSVDKRLSQYKKISKIANMEEIKYRGQIDLANWICSGMKKSGAEIDIEVAKYLADVCGPSMRYLHSEVKKLAILYRNGEKVTRELIDNVCVKSEQGVIFDLTDAIGNKDKVRALRLVEELILRKEAEQFILIMLYKHFRNLFLLRVATDEGYAGAEYLGINPYVYRKLVSQVKNYTDKELREILARLTEFDYKSKRGEINLRTGIEMIISCL